VQVVVSNSGYTSPTATVTTQSVAPAFFLVDGKYAIAQHGSNLSTLVGPTSLGSAYSPAASGETIVLYGTGFGTTNPAVPNGQLVSGSPSVVTMPTIQVNGQNATVVYGGLVSQSAGLYQFNVTLPTGLPSGDQAITASINGVTSPSGVFVTIQ
jgi:uncharacterized protein (TIGR03437 family)